MGRWSNHADQQERLEALLATAPSGSLVPIVRAPKQVQRRLDRSQTAEVVAGYQAGETVYQLARRFGIHRETVAILLERQGVPRRRRSLTPAQVTKAVSLYAMNQPLTRIAPQLGCHPDTVRRALVKAGVQMRDNNHGRERQGGNTREVPASLPS